MIDMALAGGGSSTRSKRPAAYPGGIGGYISKAEGARLVLSDGRVLIDWVSALGACPLGSAHPAVMSAVMRQARYGASFSMPHRLEAVVAEKLVQALHWPDQIRFVKTGSEACAGAVRIAREATGRTPIVVLRGHYHGWHDWHAVTAEDHPGVPDELGSGVRIAGSLHDAEALLPGAAAIMLEPVTRDWVPTRAELGNLRDAAHAAGALFILDEMLMGGRVALGGASEAYGLTPDLATYGKAFGGGLPLAFVAGSRNLMRYGMYVSGTFSGEALSLAACEAVLAVYEKEPIIERITQAGLAMQEAVTGSRVEDLAVTGRPQFFALRFAENHVDRMSRLVATAAQRGVLLHPGIVIPNAVLTQDELAHSVRVVRETLDGLDQVEPVTPYETGIRA